MFRILIKKIEVMANILMSRESEYIYDDVFLVYTSRGAF